MDKSTTTTIYFLRLALAASFLSAVADRFGLWGPPGAPGIAWGSFANFTSYTAVLTPWAPAALLPIVAWAVTVLEVALGLLLIAGIRLRETALASSALLLVFALSMAVTTGLNRPLSYSVFTASAAALAIFVLENHSSKETK